MSDLTATGPETGNIAGAATKGIIGYRGKSVGAGRRSLSKQQA